LDILTYQRMKQFLLFTIFLLTWNLCPVSSQLITNFIFQNTTIKDQVRFSKLYLPIDQHTEFKPELYPYSIWVSPIYAVTSLSNTVELCAKGKEQISKVIPELFNSSLVTDYCQQYLCSNETPLFVRLSKNTSYSESFRTSAHNLHVSVNRICLQCDLTYNQNFTNTSCPWVMKNYCNHCSSASTCIYFEREQGLCYDSSTGHYYQQDDFTHKVLFWIFMYASPVFFLIISILQLILTILFLVIPEIFFIVDNFKENRTLYTWKDKVRLIFSISNQIKFIIIVMLLIGIVTIIIDLIVPWMFVKVFLVPILYSILYFVFILITILWFHIVQEMDAYSTKPLATVAKIIYVISIVFLILIDFIIIFFYISYAYIDNYDRKIFIYFLGVFGLWYPTLCFLCAILIFISGFLIIYKVQTNKMLKEQYGGCLGVFVKLKFSRFMVFAALDMILWGILSVNTNLQFIIGKDYLSNALFMLSFPFYSFGISLTIGIVMFGFFDKMRFVKMFEICCGRFCRKYFNVEK
jgi:hypothetical protein